jgi:hypothetical protein
MARAQEVERLVNAGLSGNKDLFCKVVTALAAEARAKKHDAHAFNLESALARTKANSGSFVAPGANHLFSAADIPHCLSVTPSKCFDDLVLPDHAWEVCTELLTEHQEREKLSKFNLCPRNRLLFVGPPGNGKTSLAEALAEALHLPFFIVLYEGLVGSLLGETGSRLLKLFKALENRQCVIFFDEFETIAKERGDIREVGEMSRIVSSLLTNFDRLPSHVIVIAASNHGTMLDSAVWRRFQIQITLEAPTQQDVAVWLTRFEKRVGMPVGSSPGAVAKALYGEFENFSDLETFCLDALRYVCLYAPKGGLAGAIIQRAERRKALRLGKAAPVRLSSSG